MVINAIETNYDGINFRSRAEARWAVFFNKIGLKYLYESEGYNLNGLYYLPDFYIPSLDLFIEVKGIMNEKDYEKITKLCYYSKKKVYVVGPEIPYIDKNNIEMSDGGYFLTMESNLWDWYYDSPFNYMLFPPEEDNEEDKKKDIICGSDHPYMFCECPDCGKIGIEFDARSDRLLCKNKCKTHSYNSDKAYNGASEKLVNGFILARKYRFKND